jgi:hypothetical protein
MKRIKIRIVDINLFYSYTKNKYPKYKLFYLNTKHQKKDFHVQLLLFFRRMLYKK